MEENNFEWITDTPFIDTVSIDNVLVGMTVKLSPESDYHHQAEGESGTIVGLNSVIDANKWVYVKWSEGNTMDYRIGPYDFDLLSEFYYYGRE
jgi:hypothetical protein